MSNYLIGIFDKIRKSSAKILDARWIPDEGEESSQAFLKANESYLMVHVSEMRLARNRVWLREYSPIALSLVEYEYGAKQVTIPIVVGPNLINKYLKAVPNDLVLRNTPVSGVHLYVGKQFSITLVLAQVRHTDYTRQMLKLVEETAGVFSHATGTTLSVDFGNQVKLADAILNGVEGLLGIDETEPLIGQRFVFDQATDGIMRPGYYAMVARELSEQEWSELRVSEGRLFRGNVELSGEDYILLKVSSLDRRDDWAAMFDPDMGSIIETAWSRDSESWEQAKAQFFALSAKILSSPDLSRNQRREVQASYQQQLLENRDQILSARNLGRSAKYEDPESVHEIATDETDQTLLSNVLKL